MAGKLGTSLLLTKKEKPHPKIVGELLYYARSVEPMILVKLGYVSANQAKSNKTNS